jgi:hypothetical protein
VCYPAGLPEKPDGRQPARSNEAESGDSRRKEWLF